MIKPSTEVLSPFPISAPPDKDLLMRTSSRGPPSPPHFPPDINREISLTTLRFSPTPTSNQHNCATLSSPLLSRKSVGPTTLIFSGLTTDSQIQHQMSQLHRSLFSSSAPPAREVFPTGPSPPVGAPSGPRAEREGPPSGAPLGPRALSFHNNTLPATHPGTTSSSSFSSRSQVTAPESFHGQATPEVASAKRSVKHLTCHFWRTSGACKKGRACGYAHWDTGKYAQVPVRLFPNAPAFAGRNLVAQQARLRREAVGAPAARERVAAEWRQGRVEEEEDRGRGRERERHQRVPQRVALVAGEWRALAVEGWDRQSEGLAFPLVTRWMLGVDGTDQDSTEPESCEWDDCPETVQSVLRMMGGEVSADFDPRG